MPPALVELAGDEDEDDEELVALPAPEAASADEKTGEV